MHIPKKRNHKPSEHLPLSSAQKWFMGEIGKFKHPGWETIEFFVKTKVPMDEKAMEQAIYLLLEKYENLRVRIVNHDGQWIQEVYPVSEADPFSSYDFTNEPEDRRLDKARQVCIRIRDWLLPKRGNLIKLLFFKYAENEGRIWFCIHHIISDYVSTVILSGEFMATYNSIIQGKELKRQPVKEYRKWMYLVDGYSRDVLMPSEMEYWISLPWDKAKILPSDYPQKFYKDEIVIEALNNKTLIDSYRSDTFLMEQEETLKLISIYGADFEHLLIAAFFLAVTGYFNMDWLDMNISYSGRNILPPEYGVNMNGLIGWLASVRAMLLEKPNTGNTELDIQQVIEQIKSIPNAGIGFYLIADCMKDDLLKASYMNSRTQAGIIFNYLGRGDTKTVNPQYEIVDEDLGRTLHPGEMKNKLFECLAGIDGNRLFFRVAYPDQYFKVETIDALMHSVLAIFRTVIAAKSMPPVVVEIPHNPVSVN
jgi:non-ribosomal peptide synthase protein (TIGR01720 family)